MFGLVMPCAVANNIEKVQAAQIAAGAGAGSSFGPAGAVLGAAAGGVALFLAAEHTKNKQGKNWDKHTKPRAGRTNTKNRLQPGWTSRSNKGGGGSFSGRGGASRDF